MKKALSFIIMFVYFTQIGLVAGDELKRPIILSYYWPVQKGAKNFRNLTMRTPNVIDILANGSHGNSSVREYWRNKGKVILNRVYFGRVHRDEPSLFNYFSENIREGQGIIIDEIAGNKLREHEGIIFINTLKKLRQEYPDKIIAVWGSSWNLPRCKNVLKAVNETADILIFEIYLSESFVKANGFKEFRTKIDEIEKEVPGITQKTIIGIGLYSKMNDVETVDFEPHISSQLHYLRSDPVLKKLPGIALYAPVYLPVQTQKELDNLLEELFYKNGD